MHAATGATLPKLFGLLPIAALISFALTAPPAHADDGGAVAAGIIGGLAAGTLIGAAAAGIIGGLAAGTLIGAAVTAPPPPMYVGCYGTHGRPYWGGWG
jgi:hypothetical protein